MAVILITEIINDSTIILIWETALFREICGWRKIEMSERNTCS